MEKKNINEAKKDIKRQRIERYFLESTVEIIKNEGYEGVAVRKVADLAGYSYATIYNYYADLNELLWHTRKAMIKETAEYIMNESRNVGTGINGIKEIFRIYIKYYFENPNIFKFFYFCKLNRPAKHDERGIPEQRFEDSWRDTFMSFALEGIIREEDIETIAKTIIYAVHGMIALCLSNVGDLTEESIFTDLEKMIDHLLMKK